jgi:ADP-ribose pyrophosphatase YjhB (NUDIX family)
MWIMTPLGFFSIVQKPDDIETGTLTIRARARGDLDALRQHYLPGLGPVLVNAGTDYRYRAHAPREAIAAAMHALVSDIDYGNFKNEVQQQQGKARAHVYHKVWDALWEIGEPVSQKTNLHPAYGGVLINDLGQILLCKPRNEFDGYVWTFPKGRPESGETAEETALREVLEETGYNARIIDKLPGIHEGGTSLTQYFLMHPTGGNGAIGGEVKELRWVTTDEAKALLSQTTNAKGRSRDLRVLQDVCHYLQCRHE